MQTLKLKKNVTSAIVTNINTAKSALEQQISEKTIHVLVCVNVKGITYCHSAYRNFLEADAELKRQKEKTENLIHGIKFHIEQVIFFEN
jgi:hypothetical protein